LHLLTGRRYAILGDNGCGKTTLLRRIATGMLPGFPRHLRVLLLEQEAVADERAALEVVLTGSEEECADVRAKVLIDI